MEHRITFTTHKRAGCVCGFVAEATSHEGARRRVIRHITKPEAPGKIADTPQDHAGCKIEAWSGRWGVCTEHRVYIDQDAGGVDTAQTALELGLASV